MKEEKTIITKPKGITVRNFLNLDIWIPDIGFFFEYMDKSGKYVRAFDAPASNEYLLEKLQPEDLNRNIDMVFPEDGEIVIKV